VLTAAHCVVEGAGVSVSFGNDRTQFSVKVPSSRVLAHPGYNRGVASAPHPEELDVALVFLERPVFDRAKLHRPSLETPTNRGSIGIGIAGWSICGPTLGTSDFSVTKRQAAIWQSGTYQGPSGAVPLNLYRNTGVDGSRWFRAGSDVGACSGDSGGPLFVAHPDGTREVFGVASVAITDAAGQIIAAYWADITSNQVKSWILANVLDSANGTRTSDWLTAHGKDVATFWYGEADYTGACDAAQDPDCDYWYSQHDNRPSFANPEQETPCGGICAAPVRISSQYYPSGPLGPAATCHESYQSINGFICSMDSSRAALINGNPVSCGQAVTLPPQRNGGYCIQTAAGPSDTAFFTTW
jgi:Trypsin